MSYEIDHIFIMASKGAPEAQLLIDFGLTEGPNRIHKGQGTQNRCFFFNNVMVELLWVYDEQDAQNKITTPTTLWPRWNLRNSDASAFGLCLRSNDKNNNIAPFKSWKYQPDLFPKPMYVSIAESVVNLKEPFIFFSPMGHRSDTSDYSSESERQHKIGFKVLTEISLNKPDEDSSDAFDALLQYNIIAINSELNDKIELQFDGNCKGNVKDFTPDLPIIIRW